MSSKSRRILVPIVFKDYSLNICKYALALAEKIQAEIKLLHVCRTQRKGEPYSEYAFQTTEGKQITIQFTEAEKRLKMIAADLNRQVREKGIPNVSVDYMLAKGNISDEIVRVSNYYDPHLIILGTKGQGKKSGVLIGSLTKNIAERLSHTVLAIPEDTEYGNFEDIKVLYATDFNESDYSSLNKLLFLLSPFSAKVYCVHIETTDAIKKEKMDILQSRISNEYSNYDIECVLTHSKDLVTGIQEFINKNSVDLISFTSPRKNAFQRLFQPDHLNKIFFYTNVPLLIFNK